MTFHEIFFSVFVFIDQLLIISTKAAKTQKQKRKNPVWYVPNTRANASPIPTASNYK